MSQQRLYTWVQGAVFIITRILSSSGPEFAPYPPCQHAEFALYPSFQQIIGVSTGCKASNDSNLQDLGHFGEFTDSEELKVFKDLEN